MTLGCILGLPFCINSYGTGGLRMPSRYPNSPSRQQGRVRSVPKSITCSAAITSLQYTGLHVVGVSTIVWGVKREIGSGSSRYGQTMSTVELVRQRITGMLISRESIALVGGWEEFHFTLEKDFGSRVMLLWSTDTDQNLLYVTTAHHSSPTPPNPHEASSMFPRSDT